MLKKILRSAGFFAGLVAILVILSIIIIPNEEIYNVVAFDKKTKSVSEEREESLDVIFLGDSEVYASFSPLQMWNENGFTSYVCAYSLQRLCDTKAMLEKVCKRQTPKVVVIETNCLFRYAGTFKDPDDKSINNASKVLPVLKYHSRWKSYLPEDLFGDDEVEEDAKYKGFRIRVSTIPYKDGSYVKKTDKIRHIPALGQQYLSEIKDYCDSIGAKLVFVSVPTPDNWSYTKHNGAQKWADENGIDYVDMNLMQEELGIDWEKDTKDQGNHLNLLGAIKVTSFYGKYLSDTYNLPDHRDDAEYSDWNDSYNEYYDKITKYCE